MGLASVWASKTASAGSAAAWKADLAGHDTGAAPAGPRELVTAVTELEDAARLVIFTTVHNGLHHKVKKVESIFPSSLSCRGGS